MRDYDFQLLVCPCNTVSDFPERCPYHSSPRQVEDYGDWFDINYRNKTRSSWTCHRCSKVNAPHVDQCSCPGSSWTLTYSPTTTTFTTSSSGTAYVPSFEAVREKVGDVEYSWILCEHANEFPMACPCSDNCICRHEGGCVTPSK